MIFYLGSHHINTTTLPYIYIRWPWPFHHCPAYNAIVMGMLNTKETLCLEHSLKPAFQPFHAGHPGWLVIGVLRPSNIYNFISGWALTCDSAHSWRLYNPAPLGDQVVNTMTWYPTQSDYPDTKSTSPCPILIMQSAWLESDKYTFLSHCFVSTSVQICGFRSIDLPKWETDAQLIWPSHLDSSPWWSPPGGQV